MNTKLSDSPDPVKHMDVLTKLIAIIIGNSLSAIAINGFFVPNNLLSGGVGGIAIIGHYLFNLPVGLIVFIINIPIFIIGSKIIDKQFTIYSFISMLILSFLLSVTEGISEYIQMNDILLAAIFGGVLSGIGMGIMFRNRTSQGGLDIIAAIIKKKMNMNIGTVLLGVNLVIISSSSILFGASSAMYTLIGLYIAYQVLEKVQIGFDTKNTVMIISDESQQLANEIISKLGRGVTFLKGEGAYSKDDKNIIYCTIMSRQVGQLKEIVETIDADAFITINEAQEVRGKGFKTIGI